jgi:hypothetical protein
LPKLAREVLSLQELLVAFEVFGVYITCPPVHELHFFPDSPEGLSCILNKLINLLLVLKLKILLVSLLLLFLFLLLFILVELFIFDLLLCFLFGR